MLHPIGLEYEVPGSQRQPITNLNEVPPPVTVEVIQITVQIRGKAKLPSPDILGGQFPRDRKYLSHDDLESEFGVDPESLEKFRQYAADQGIETERTADSRLLTCFAPLERLKQAFGVDLRWFECPAQHRIVRGREGSVWLPRFLEGAVTGVFGLDDRPAVASPHGEEMPPDSLRIVNLPELARHYAFPEESDGSGQTVAFLEFNSGYLETDLDGHFASVNQLRPEVRPVLVYSGQNFGITGRGEPMLSMSIVGGAAPGARHVLYFAPNDDASVLQAFAAAIFDRENLPSVISMSWGFLERDVTRQYVWALERLLRAAALLGITVVAAIGNGGSRMGRKDAPHVTYPGSSPCVLACGASEIRDLNTQPGPEVVWNDGRGLATGGGLSRIFDTTPGWQLRDDVRLHRGGPAAPGRHLPDVTGHSQNFGFFLDGSPQASVMGGTSAVAPLWAALVARLNGALKVRVGFLNPLLYAPEAAGAFRDITEGDNGDFTAGEGWDACSGLGSPDGARLLSYLQNGQVG